MLTIIASGNLTTPFVSTSSILGPITDILWSSTSLNSLFITSSQASVLFPPNSANMSFFLILSPSNAAANDTGIGISVIFIFIPLASNEVATNLS